MQAVLRKDVDKVGLDRITFSPVENVLVNGQAIVTVGSHTGFGGVVSTGNKRILAGPDRLPVVGVGGNFVGEGLGGGILNNVTQNGSPNVFMGNNL